MRVFLLIISIVVSAVLLSTPVKAENFSVSSLNVDVVLATDGSVNVTEDIVLDSESTLTWEIFSRAKNLKVMADNKLVPPNKIKTSANGNGRLIESNVTAKLWTISFISSSALIRQNDRDQIYFKILEEPGATIRNLDARITLPESYNHNYNLAGNAYAIGGVAIPQVETRASSIVYHLDYAGPKSFVTINASWPKSVLALTILQEFKLSLKNLDAIPWLVLGLSLPLLSLIVLLRLIIKQRRDEFQLVVSINKSPPSALSPVLAGVIVNKKVYPEQLTALLIDFCQRGYLVIVKKGDSYYLGRRRPPDEHLTKWESEILEKVWPAVGTTVSAEEVHMITKTLLFSPEIKDAFSRIYQIITDQEIFAENPHLTRVRYKLIALGFYFLGVVGLIWTAISSSSPYLIIPIVGMMVISWLIMRLTPKLIHYSSEGYIARRAWLEFMNYLSSPNPIEPEASRNQTFEKYLAYAISLKCGEAWANRFESSRATLIRPDWFINYQSSSVADYTQELFAFGKSIGSMLANLRGPLVN